MSGRQKVPHHTGIGASGMSPLLFNRSTTRSGSSATTRSGSSASTQSSRSHSGYSDLVPIYVPREHLEEVQRFILALDRVNRLPSRSSNAGFALDGRQSVSDNGRSVDEDFDEDPVELVSAFSRLSTATTASTPSAPLRTLHNNAQANMPTTLTRSTLRAPAGRPYTATQTPVKRLISTVPGRSAAADRKSTKNNRYYVVLVGKLAGVFWDEWVYVFPIVENVSGALYKSFSTHLEALEYYEAKKAEGLVNIARDPGDDEVFGPIEDAIQ